MKNIFRLQNWYALEKTVGGLKFAVILIILFSISMILGTFCESYYGTEFANRFIYKSSFFMFLQFLLFLSIFMAALLRLPPKKRLYGFYVIHSGLIIICCGSFVTYFAGVDGSITLEPQSSSREIILNEDVLRIQFLDSGEEVTYKLPDGAFSQEIAAKYQNIEIKQFLPFSDDSIDWVNEEMPAYGTHSRHSGQFVLINPMAAQDFTLSLHPEAQGFQNSLKLGPLQIHYMPSAFSECFDKQNESELILWDAKKNTCFTPESLNVHVQKTSEGTRFLAFNYEGTIYSFFPDHSPWPMDIKLQQNKLGNLRIFSKGVFKNSPNLFIFGKKIAFFQEIGESAKWQVKDLNLSTPVGLPWMGSKLQLLRHEETAVPRYIPNFTMPIQSNGNLVKGDQKAVQISVAGRNYWATSKRALTLLIEGKKVRFLVDKKTIKLPFEFALEKFKMDVDPGTKTPASYESFVRLYEANGVTSHHIFMNNPLKFRGFTFYQASYFQTNEGKYGSVLSANYDPGRFLKYFGSVLLVIGSIWHYLLNRRKIRKESFS
ncbi:MAG: cytochrome c biogenesis protein ResB [Halobacteriovoraceae bacterium]|nr:cytochrome c biogenesis protein ResB [Halobacteriovoraceae bacterium]